jgi:phage terminase large subunit GpA-like protein
MARQTRGTLQAVPCPHCNKANCFKGDEFGEDVAVTGLIEKGTVLLCDHCHRKMVIAQVMPVTMIWLKAVR